MRTMATFCDLCAHDGEMRLAKGYYIADDGNRWHICATHIKEVKGYGFKTHEFETLGDVDEDLFQE